MTQIITVGLVTVGTVFWLYFFSGFDPHAHSKKVLLEAFLLGIIGALAAIIVELSLFQTLTQQNTIGVAIVEEAIKFLVVYLVILRRAGNLFEPIDGVMLLLMSALGFSFAEDITVALSSQTVQIIFARVFLSKVLHLTASGFIGYGYALSIFTQYKSQFFWGLTAAILWHWFYDYVLILGGEQNQFFLVIAFLIIFTLGYLIRILQSLEFSHSQEAQEE